MEGEGPRLLDLISKERDWVDKEVCKGKNRFEEKLELRLGLPGEETEKEEKQSAKSVFSLSFPENVAKKAFLGTAEAKEGKGTEREASGVHLVAHGTRNANSSIANNSSQTRNSNAPVVGWPPIRSFRKNLGSSSISKSPLDTQDASLVNSNRADINKKGLFVKINMDGIPIGRKINLKAYGGYDELASAVDQLFRGVLAAQRDSLVSEIEKSVGEEKQDIKVLLDGSGKYTLVYEDEEGDRVLVGDVPWRMFISTAKRLRVLKTSDLSVSYINTASRKRAATEC
ncbi:auxin-responsive protein IAA16-like [Carex rostrata]